MTLRIIVIVLSILLECKQFTCADDTREFSSVRSIEISEENLKSTCHHEDVTRYLTWVATQYKSIARLVSIGNSTQGRELWTIIISEQSDQRPILRPQVKFVGNVNGFSGPSCVVLIKLIKFLVENYEADIALRPLIDNTEIHILPNMNPDGYAKSLPGECFKHDGKLNANEVDLNRNFPDMFHPHDDHEDDPVLEMETKAIIDWIQKNNFVVSASFISGVKVVSFPYDTVQTEGYVAGMPHATPDDKTFQYLARSYVGFVHEQDNTTDWTCPSLKRSFPEGIVNGAEWHSVSGTMMDYNYNNAVFEILVGLSCCRNDNDPNNLEKLWRINKYALISLIVEAHFSFRGQVVDSETKLPMANVELAVEDEHEQTGSPIMPFFTNSRGEFWRVLLAGRYNLKAFFKNYLPFSHSIEIPSGTQGPPQILIEMDHKGKRRRLRKMPNVKTTTEKLPYEEFLNTNNGPNDFYDHIEAARIFEEFQRNNHLVHSPPYNGSIAQSDFHELEAFHRIFQSHKNSVAMLRNNLCSTLILLCSFFTAFFG